MQLLEQLKNILKNSFVKNVLTLFSGSVIGQGIMLLSIPILTRLFSEEAFGILALYSSVILITKTIATLRFELAIILPKRNKDAINLFVFNIIVVLIISILIFIILYFFQNKISLFLNIQKLAYFIYFVPLSVFFIGSITALEYWNNRTNLFKNISYGAVSKSLSISSTQLLTGLSTFKFIGLIPGLIVAQFVNLIVLIKTSLKTLVILFKYTSFKRMLYLARKYKDIPLFNTILSFTNILSNELPVILITKYFGLATAGIYGIAVKVSKLPPGIIGQSIGQVFFNEASKVYNAGGDLYKLIKRTYKNLLLTAIFIFVPLFLISFFLNYIFGQEWGNSGIYVRILIPWLFVGFLSAPISSLIVILRKQKVILIYDLLLLISRAIALHVGFVFYNDILVSLTLFSIVGVVFNSLILLYFFRISKMVNKKANIYE